MLTLFGLGREMKRHFSRLLISYDYSPHPSVSKIIMDLIADILTLYIIYNLRFIRRVPMLNRITIKNRLWVSEININRETMIAFFVC